ncbi:MAG: HIT family protein [Verrucomicrobia bacterium]|nr:HIT family protein [Verrucomicrobiota bacterium]
MSKISLSIKWGASLILLIGGGTWFACNWDFSHQTFEGCPFCNEKLLQIQEFAREGEALAILTHKPAVPGHVLIIPARHVERFEELSAQEILAIGEMIKRVDRAVRQLYGTTGYDLLEKNGREAGQTVTHVHFHYLPRSEKMGEVGFLSRFFLRPLLKPLTEEEMKELNELLHSAALE